MKTKLIFDKLYRALRLELCCDCIQDPDECAAVCHAFEIARDYARAITRGTDHIRKRIYYYSSRAVCPPAGYFVADIYGTEQDRRIAIVTERQYKRALKNVYVNSSCGIWYAVSFPVFVQRPDGSLYRPSAPGHDN